MSKKIKMKDVQTRRKSESWAQIAGSFDVSPVTLRRHYYAWLKGQQTTTTPVKETGTTDPEPKEPTPEPETAQPAKRTTRVGGDYNEEWPSAQLVPLAQVIAEVADGVEVGQRKTTVFLKHPSHKKQLITFFGSVTKPGAFSPFFLAKDGAKPDTLGLMTLRFRDAEHVSKVGAEVLRRAGLL